MTANQPAPPVPARKFGTFTGVFTPTLLTIVGVIMYVRLGWVVGNAGLVGAWAILALGIGITVCTGLSLSSIATNTRLGHGGPYAMIQRSLGLEVGGSIGVPLYLSRPLGVAMYIFGFREGWLWVPEFADHDPLLIDLSVYAALFAFAFISADLAFRVQYLIMGVLAFSLLMVVISPQTFAPAHAIHWWGDYPGFPENGFEGVDFWVVFAIFFPATTGILAGANMSGDLVNPRSAIPVGTLWAIAVSSIIYFALSFWLARAASPEELVSNYTVLIDESFWGPGVLAGLLGATFSSALAGAVGGPRILLAMAQHGLTPRSDWLSKTTNAGEPRNAVALTALLTLACVMMRDLNAIAPLVTMFFLITYLMINVVLLVESSLGLVSFRPTLRIPRLVPFLGAVGCIFCMFIVNPTFGLVAIATSFAVYVWLQRFAAKDAIPEDSRSSIFAALAEWAAAKVEHLHGQDVERAWKPNLMVPVDDPALVRGDFQFLVDVCRPEGSVMLLGITKPGYQKQLERPVEELASAFREQGVHSRRAIVGAESFHDGVLHGLETSQGAFFRPNILFMMLPTDQERFEEFGSLIVEAKRTRVGVLFLAEHSRAHLARRHAINLYVRPHTSWDVEDAFDTNNIDLNLLIGYRLMRQWNAELTLITVIKHPDDRAMAAAFLDELCDLARFPDRTQRLVMVGEFEECAAKAPQADVSVMGLQPKPDFALMLRCIELTSSTCLFVADSGRENARA